MSSFTPIRLGHGQDPDQTTPWFPPTKDSLGLLIAGRSGTGKSVLAHHIAKANAQAGVEVAMIRSSIQAKIAPHWDYPMGDEPTDDLYDANRLVAITERVTDRYFTGDAKTHPPLLIVIDGLEDIIGSQKADQSPATFSAIKDLLFILNFGPTVNATTVMTINPTIQCNAMTFDWTQSLDRLILGGDLAVQELLMPEDFYIDGDFHHDHQARFHQWSMAIWHPAHADQYVGAVPLVMPNLISG